MTARFTVTVTEDSVGPEHLGTSTTAVHDVDGQPIKVPDATLRVIRCIAAGPQQLDDLVEAVWGANPPASANAAIHNRLSKLRRIAPGLVDRRHDRYSLGSDVAVKTAHVGARPSAVAPAETSPLDPYDEHQRAERIARFAAAGDRRAALEELERTRVDLAEVGLEPGRQLTDLARLVADGERRIERLLGAEQQTLDVGIALGSFAVEDLVTVARRWLVGRGSGTLVLSGPPGSGRSHALRVIRDLAIGLGRGAMSVRATTFSKLPVIPVGATRAGASTIVMVDDLDHANDATLRMIQRLPQRWTDPSLKLAVVVGERGAAETVVDQCNPGSAPPVHVEVRAWSDAQRTQLLDRLTLTADQRTAIEQALTRRRGRRDGALTNRATLDAIRLATGDAADRLAFDRLVASGSAANPLPDSLDAAMVSTMLDALDPAGRHIVELLALTATPILFDDLEALSPGARQQIRRPEVRRLLDLDDIAGRARTRDSVVDRVALDHLSPRRRVDIHTVLSHATYRHEDAAVKARRLAAHGAEADLSPIEAARSVRFFADAVAAAGDRLTAADVSQLAADTVGPVDPLQFCELSIRAGTELLTAGDPVGLQSMENALDVAIAHGLTSLAARATWSYCRLGPTSGAGQLDQRAATMLKAVEPMLTNDADLAFLLSAWAMVHTLTGDSIRCAHAYDRAERHARASGSDEALAATLPSSFMSIATPDHLDRREMVARELHGLADRTGRLDSRWEALHLDFSNQLQRGDPMLRPTLDQLRDVTGQLDGAQHDWELTYLSAVVAQLDDDVDEAARLAEESLNLDGAVGESRRTAVFGAILLGNHLALGTVAELAPFLEQMIEEQPLLAAWRAPFALAAAELGRFDEAIHHVDWLLAPGSIDPDCTMTAVGMITAVAAATVAEMNEMAEMAKTDATDATATSRRLVERSIDLLTPWSGRWSWYGAGTYGPIDGALARLHRCVGEESKAVPLAAAAASQAARLRAPAHSRAAADLLT